MSMTVLRAQLAVEGPLAVFEKRGDSGAVTTCHFCVACGSRLFHTSDRAPGAATLKLGTLDDTSDIAPVAHLWTQRKQAWVRLDPDVPAFETQPSDLAAWRRSLLADNAGGGDRR
jgi:hypothetical protein